MPSSRRLITSTTLSSSAASVTFSSIPNTYKDLVVKASVRITGAGTVVNGYYLFNNDALGVAAGYTQLTGNGSTAASSRFNSSFGAGFYQVNGTSTAANIFSNTEIYVPNYNASAVKPISVFSVVEDNATAAGIQVAAELYGTTTPITSLTLRPDVSFGSGSSFYLYGLLDS